MKPLIKWAGGKTKLLPELVKRIPKDYNQYHEPFLGGGALAFHLQPPRAILTDINKELIEFYEVIRDTPEEFIRYLNEFSKGDNTEEKYYQIREMSLETLSPTILAARFYYLNKTCFNGLYRTNKTGQFNVPWGKRDKFPPVDLKTINEMSAYLKTVKIDVRGYEDLSWFQPGDFVYFDPPYIPLNPKEKYFAGYGTQFDYPHQENLRNICRILRNTGVKGLASNSDTPLSRELYKDFAVETIMAPRSISRDGNGRKKIGEILISF